MSVAVMCIAGLRVVQIWLNGAIELSAAQLPLNIASRIVLVSTDFCLIR